jgi:hypothetical protein
MTGKAQMDDYVLCPGCTEAKGREQYHNKDDLRPAGPRIKGEGTPWGGQASANGKLVCPRGHPIEVPAPDPAPSA